MVTNFLIKMLAGIVQGVLSVIPNWSVDTSTIDHARNAGYSTGSIEGWFPLLFMLACVAVILAVRLFFLVWNGVQWLYHLIPFNG